MKKKEIFLLINLFIFIIVLSFLIGDENLPQQDQRDIVIKKLWRQCEENLPPGSYQINLLSNNAVVLIDLDDTTDTTLLLETNYENPKLKLRITIPINDSIINKFKSKQGDELLSEIGKLFEKNS